MTEGAKSSEKKQAGQATWIITTCTAITIIAEIASQFILGRSLGVNLDVAIAALGIPTFGYSISRGIAKMSKVETVIQSPAQETKNDVTNALKSLSETFNNQARTQDRTRDFPKL